MLDLKTLATFVKVAERRSFAQAAHALGITQSGVSNAIGRLERQLGVRLLARTTRSVRLTEDGAAFLERCKRILADLEEAELMLGRARVTPVGRLRVDMPVSFGRLKIVPLLGAFQERFPDVSLALSFTDRFVDLVDEGIDIAVRFGPLRDSSLIARPLTATRFRVVGAPSYFEKHGKPRRPEDLARHNCLMFTRSTTSLTREWRFQRDGAGFTVVPHGSMSFSDGGAICEAACAGYGLVQMHGYYSDSHIAARKLKPVLESFAPPADQISLVYPTARHLAPKVRCFVDFLLAALRKTR
jgi:LysR family transcriptional regulator, regulator for bpeEF and oprC